MFSYMPFMYGMVAVVVGVAVCFSSCNRWVNVSSNEVGVVVVL